MSTTIRLAAVAVGITSALLVAGAAAQSAPAPDQVLDVNAKNIRVVVANTGHRPITQR